MGDGMRYSHLWSLLILLTVCSPEGSSTPRPPSRNPFQPVQRSTPTPRSVEPLSLEAYPLEQLRLTAIVRNADGELFGSVEIPSGIGFKVTQGTRIGSSGGFVTEVRNDGIAIQEGDSDPTVALPGREIMLRPKNE